MLPYLFLLIIFSSVTCYTFQQWHSIRNLLKNSELPDKYKNEIRNKIFVDHYYNFTLKYTWDFKKKNNYMPTVAKANIYDLNYYSVKGLHIACKNYNGMAGFYHYVKPIMYYNLLRGVTDLNHIQKLPHYLIVDRKWKNKNKKKYELMTKPPLYASDYDCEPYIKIKDINNNINQLKEIVYALPPRDRRIFLYRYDIETFRTIRSLKHVGELMCCTLEQVRLDINRILQIISHEILLY